jgi:hypothetical protein
MSRFSTSFEPPSWDVVKFGIAAFALLMAISGIIFDQPILGIAGVVILLIALATRWRSPASD